MKRVTIKGDRAAGYETVIDGINVSEQITDLQLAMGGGQPPRLLIGTQAGRVDIEADAKVVLADPEAECRAILAFLDGIDPVALEEAMLEGGMESSPAQMALKQLRALALKSYGG
jgi:hypothetical protein